MYGRGNIFNRDANANTNPYSTNTSYTPSNYTGGLNRSTVGQVQLIGSNRQEYKNEQPSTRLTDIIRGWKENPPCSFLTKQMCLHLTPAEFRIEDYFLIRKKQLSARQEPNLRDAIRKGAFNEELLNIDPGPLPLISRDPPLDLDAERRLGSNDHSNIYNNNGGYNSNSNGNGYNYSSTGNQGGNTFGANNTSTGNLFTSRTIQNTGSTNIFGNNSNSNNTSNTNMFLRNGNGQSGSNVFNNTGQTGNTQGGNMQGGNLQGGHMQGGNMQGGNMQTSNALFGNRAGNGPIGVNNAQTGNNIFRGNGAGNGVVNGGSNLMNNTSNLANAFNRPTASSIPTNNIFSSGMGNRTGSNLMSNQQNNGNNGYGQSNSSQTNSLFPTNSSSQLVDNLQAFLNENRQFLQMILTGKDEAKASVTPPPPRFDYFQDRYEEQLDYSSKRRSNSPQSIIYVNIEREKDRDSPHKEKVNRKKQAKLESEVEPKSAMPKRMQNPMLMQDSFGSMIQSKIKDNNISKMQNRYTSQLRHSQFEHKAVSTLYYDCQCLIDVTLEIKWEHDPLADLLPDWPVISKTVLMSCYRPNDSHCLRELRQKLKSQFPVVRMDAQFVIESTNEIQRGLTIKGTLLQKLVNLSLPDYRVFYSQLRNGLLYNFTLSNTFGSVSWQRPVPLETLDFANCEVGFSIGNNIITCDVEALNAKCRVTFYDAPSKIKKAFLEDPVETQKEFAVQLLSYSKDFHLQGIWRDGNNCSWSMDVQQFANQQEDQ